MPRAIVPPAVGARLRGRSSRGLHVAVTGGARGIGAAVGEAFARAGARVSLGDLDALAAERAAATLNSQAVELGLDVTDARSFDAFLDWAQEAHGPLDVLVNNAGIMWVGPFAEEPEATALRQIDVNLHGTLRGMKAAIPAMRARGRGHVINVASAASLVAPPGEATYAATKHAVLGYSRAVRAELRGCGVRVSVVMPGVVETELAAGTSHGRARRLAPEDVARAVVGLVRRPRREIHLPASIGLATRVGALLGPAARDALERKLDPDQIAALGDGGLRSGYEHRAGVNPIPPSSGPVI